MPPSCQAEGAHDSVDIVLAEAEAIIALPLLFWDALFFERRAVELFLEEELVSTAPFYRAVATRANSVNRSPLRTGPSETSHDQAYS